MMYEYTKKGLKKVEAFIKEAEAKRKEILDVKKDTADKTVIPTAKDILRGIEVGELDENFTYSESWGVTDNYETDTPLILKLREDFACEGEGGFYDYVHYLHAKGLHIECGCGCEFYGYTCLGNAEGNPACNYSVVCDAKGDEVKDTLDDFLEAEFSEE